MDPKRLTAIPIFSELSDTEAHRLAAFATETSAAEGQILMKEGDYSVELIAIEEGTADVILGGKKVATLKAGDLIGEMGLLEHKPRTADVIVRAPALRTPRMVMQRCSASMTTMTPRGSRISISESATCVVSRSCTCGRLAKTSTTRASLDSPVILPVSAGM